MRIGIVNDSAMAIETMRRTIESDGRHGVCWLARNGAEAVEQCARDTPDLILMDLMMPVMDGVAATRKIMADTPCIILIVTASVDGRPGKVFEALGAGALDAVNTPVFASPGPENPLLRKLATLERLHASQRRLNRPEKTRPPETCCPDVDLVVIGASAGGPAALATILAEMPADFSPPIIIVQHVDAQFATGMAKWLDEHSALPVRIAREGDRPMAGTVLLAGEDAHLVFSDSGRLGYDLEPSDASSRPSIDVFFGSVAAHRKGKTVALLLTGMGKDGAKGLRTLRQAGAFTIAQDRETSVVYGMPKAAADLGAAMKVLPLHAIAGHLVKLCARSQLAGA